MAVVVTVAKGYDLGYVWKNQAQKDSAERTIGGYYINAAQAGEPPGRWWGPGAQALGFAAGQVVERGSYDAVYRQRDPATGEKLGRARGRSLGSDPPALVVDDLQVLTRASLHHGACRAPEWNNSYVIRGPGSALLTWRTVALLLPFQAGPGVIRAAGLLVNPGLEEVWLTHDVGTWRPRLEQSFAAAGLTHPSHGMPIQLPAAGVTGHLSQTSLHADVNGRADRYGSQAEPEIRAAAAQLGGFLLIVTHAADPARLNPDRLMEALASPVTLAGWARLESIQ